MIKQKDIVLLHGWGVTRNVWQGLSKGFSEYRNTYAPCLYQAALVGKDDSFESIAIELNKSIKADTIVVAWSIGGLVASHLAMLTSRVKAIVFIASAPCFINKKGWSYVIDNEGIKDLQNRLSRNSVSALVYFSGLIAYGDDSMKQTNKLMRNNLAKENETEILSSWLKQMQEVDQRNILSELKIPMKYVIGKNDSLINSKIISDINKLNENITSIVMDGCGHAPFISKQKEVIQIITELSNAKPC